MSELKTIRIGKKLTQQEAAKLLGASLRSYIMYENDDSKKTSPKYRFFLNELSSVCLLDEEHGVLTIKEIEEIVSSVLSDYEVEFCYLFGSYAKGKASETSDVDLLIATSENGLKFFEIVELLREKLHKKVDVLDINQLYNNRELLKEILKDGLKIYG